MRIIYRSIDGQFFEDDETCRKHELELETFYKMWTLEGEPTTDIQQCYYVQLNDENDAELFMEHSKANSCETRGIDKGCTGLFWWCDWETMWVPFTMTELEAHTRVFKYLSKEKENRK